MNRYPILAVASFVFGVTTGYLGEYISHHIEQLSYFGVGDPWYWWAIVPALPGDTFTFGFYNLSDSYLTDEWNYRYSVAAFNGIFWMLFIPTFSFFCYLARCLPRDLKASFLRSA